MGLLLPPVVIYPVILFTFLIKGGNSQLDVCGQASLNTKQDRIVGGQDAVAGSWPWQVSLHKFGSHFCGGSLINDRWILTAAHCFASGATNTAVYTVLLGTQTQIGNNPNQITRTLAKIIVNPNYNDQNSDNDVALLQLSSAVTFNDYIRPVCLAAPGSAFFTNVTAWVTGWGRIGSGVPLPFPQTLQEVNVPVIGNRQCNCLYGVGRITDNMICAGLLAGGKDSCQGDSGGPLVVKQGQIWIQAGVVSFGRGCALPDFPGVYTRVSQFQSWLNSQITNNLPGYVSYASSGVNGDLSINCNGLPSVAPVGSRSPVQFSFTPLFFFLSTVTSLCVFLRR